MTTISTRELLIGFNLRGVFLQLLSCFSARNRFLVEHESSEYVDDLAMRGSKKGISKLLGRLPIVGIAIGVAFGDPDAVVNAVEPIGFSPAVMGNGEWNQAQFDQWAYNKWDRHQQDLDRRASQEGIVDQ